MSGRCDGAQLVIPIYTLFLYFALILLSLQYEVMKVSDKEVCRVRDERVVLARHVSKLNLSEKLCTTVVI